MSRATLARALVRSSREPIYGRPIRTSPAPGRSTRRTSRDKPRPTSDTVWALVDEMMQGNTDAAIVLDDVIEEGVPGTTKFIKITERARSWKGVHYPEKVRPNEYAAITSGRQIVLFGLEDYYPRTPGQIAPKAVRGYLRRFRIGSVAEVGSYNLVYMGNVRKITPKTITVIENEGHRGLEKTHSMSIEKFNSKNRDFDLDAAVKRNQNWSD